MTEVAAAFAYRDAAIYRIYRAEMGGWHQQYAQRGLPHLTVIYVASAHIPEPPNRPLVRLTSSYGSYICSRRNIAHINYSARQEGNILTDDQATAMQNSNIADSTGWSEVDHRAMIPTS